jgi:U3 small nucleolar RNA-associated protein 10
MRVNSASLVRIHEFNTSSLIVAFLPYHTIPAFVTLMSILPTTIPSEYRFLDPYIRSLTAPPRAAIVQQAIKGTALLSAITENTLEACRHQHDYPALISFWGGIMTEAVNGKLDSSRSARNAVQAENDSALLQLVVPTLSESLMMKKVSGLQIASYMIVAVLASKGNLADNALSAFIEQIVCGWTSETLRPGLVCISVLTQYRSAKPLPGKVTKALLKVPDLLKTLESISQEYRVDKLVNAFALTLIDRLYKKGEDRGLPLVKSILLSEILSEKQLRTAYKALLVAAHRIDDSIDSDGHIRQQLGSVLVVLSQASGNIGTIIRQTIEEVDFDIEELELKLETTVRPRLAIEAPQEDVDTDMIEATNSQEDLDEALKKLSQQKPSVSDCFSPESDAIFSNLYTLFLAFASGKDQLAKFDDAPILGRSSAPQDAFYLSFYIRIWCGPYPTLARASALAQAKDRLKAADCASVDFQVILPYAITALRDPAKKVRQAAADLLVVLGSLYDKDNLPKSSHWPTHKAALGETQQMDSSSIQALLNKIVIPALEESVIDDTQILVALKNGLDTSKTAESREIKTSLTHSTRASIMKAISSHAVQSPFLVVKVRLLETLNQIRPASGSSRSQPLLPVLRWWAGLSKDEAARLAESQGLDEANVDLACVSVVASNDKAGIDALFDLINSPGVCERANLMQTIFSRIRTIWPSMKGDMKFSTAQAMLKLSQESFEASATQNLASIESADFLRNVELTTDILLEFLESAQDSATQATTSPANKRRRLSSAEQARAVDIQNSPEMNAILSKVTFVLELVQGSNPEDHPRLLQNLFAMLSDLQHLRTLVGSELGYLQNLVLSSLLAMIPAYKDNKDLKIDASVGHGDVLVTCIQRSSSPAVQNAALLLVASLARTAPDVVLYSVMPIFTFMGSSVLRQADDYSAHVVNQTIKEVVPPLIDTFRKSRRSLVASAAELLSSFVIAYEHVPSHRKKDLFLCLIENLGPQDFLFAILAMFVDKYGTTDNVLGFLAEIMESFSAEMQLQSLVRLLDLIRDIFKPKPGLSAVLFGKNDGSEAETQKISLKELTLLPYLLRNRKLKTEITRLAERDDMEAAKITELYATLLQEILSLADTVKTKKPLYHRCGDALSNLLGLLSIDEFIKAIESLLDKPNLALRQKVLRALEMRVDSEQTSDAKSRTALLAFLPQLTAVIRESDDIHYKHTAITCVDKIAEKYGKKDIEAVTAAAATIAGDRCLGQPFDQLKVMALLCLASLVDVLQDAIVPVLPTAVPKTLAYLRESLQAEKVDFELHDASYAFMTALAQHLPYMISGGYLDELLVCSNMSAKVVVNENSSNRLQCLRLAARLVDSKVMFTALQANWASAASSGSSVS